MPIQRRLYAYDERYKMVYTAGARFWSSYMPNERIIDILKNTPKGSKCINVGCGEGHEARLVAEAGISVTAVDLSPIVIKKARAETETSLDMEYIVGDGTNLRAIGINDTEYDLAIDVFCLQMMAEDADRKSYLGEIHRVLKPDAVFYIEDLIDLDDVIPMTSEEEHALQEIREFRKKHTFGDVTPRKIRTPEGEKEILLPLCPEGKWLSLAGYCEELIGNSFSIASADRLYTPNHGFRVVIVARKA